MVLTGPLGWFPNGRNVDSGWRLDIVSLLAVIGESAMEVHAQRTTVTWLCILPRLIPAPQGLLKAERPRRLPPVPNIKIVGAFSGTKVEELNFAANLIHNIGDLDPLQFQEWTIGYDLQAKHKPLPAISTASKSEQGQPNHGAPPPDSSTGSGDPHVSNVTNCRRNSAALEAGPPPPDTIALRALSSSESALHARNPHSTPDTREVQPDDPPSPMLGKQTRLVAIWYSATNALTVLSFCWTVGVFGWAFKIRDGVAALAIGLLALTSTLTGLARWWSPKLKERFTVDKVPFGDLVLKTRDGAFVVVHCHENIARELYTSADECKYHFEEKYSKIFVGLGTLFLMVGVVLLGNCSWTMQAAIGGTYLVLNGAYWLVALLPERHFWKLKGSKPFNMSEKETLPKDETRYVFEQPIDRTLPDKMTKAHIKQVPRGEKTETMCFTRTLWYAIQRSKSASWVAPLEAAPITPAWDCWLDEAHRNKNNEEWAAVRRKGEFLSLETVPGKDLGAPTRGACRCGQPNNTVNPAGSTATDTPMMTGSQLPMSESQATPGATASTS